MKNEVEIFFSGQSRNSSITYDSLEDHMLICRPTMIDESNALLTEVKILHDKVSLVARLKSRRSCKVETCSYSCKSQKGSKINSKAETKVETKLSECPECHGTFATKKGLKTHMFINTGETIQVSTLQI